MNVHRFAILTALATFALLLVGGLVHATDSGMACGNVWPACGTQAFPVDGTWLPAMTGGVQFEHSHRLIAGLVGILTLILAIWLWFPTRPGQAQPLALRLAGIGAVLLVAFQAMLGRKTVLEGLPDWVSALHLATAMAFFCLTLWIALGTQPRPEHASHIPAALRRGVALAALLVYVQIVLGAVVRHMDAGTVCTTFPLCDGSVFGATALTTVHMVHRIGGVIVMFAILAAMVPLLRYARHTPTLDATARAVVALTGVQIFLGVASVFSSLSPWLVTAHMGTGAVILALTSLMAFWLNPMPVASARKHQLGVPA